MGDNWLISSFEVGDAHVQNGSEESVVGVSQGYGHPDTESNARARPCQQGGPGGPWPTQLSDQFFFFFFFFSSLFFPLFSFISATPRCLE